LRIAIKRTYGRLRRQREPVTISPQKNRSKSRAESSRKRTGKPRRPVARASAKYVLEKQIGFLLRQANQRHTSIFAARIPEGLTTTQFAALAKLHEVGPCSQNHLGRLTAMDAATIKGVVDRLTKRGFVLSRPDRRDTRLLVLRLTKSGLAAIEAAIPFAVSVTEETLHPLSPSERASLLKLIRKLC